MVGGSHFEWEWSSCLEKFKGGANKLGTLRVQDEKWVKNGYSLSKSSERMTLMNPKNINNLKRWSFDYSELPDVNAFCVSAEKLQWAHEKNVKWLKDGDLSSAEEHSTTV